MNGEDIDCVMMISMMMNDDDAFDVDDELIVTVMVRDMVALVNSNELICCDECG